jgi:hypothetical protein
LLSFIAVSFNNIISNFFGKLIHAVERNHIENESIKYGKNNNNKKGDSFYQLTLKKSLGKL